MKQIIKYEATDGEVFDSKEECEEYESLSTFDSSICAYDAFMHKTTDMDQIFFINLPTAENMSWFTNKWEYEGYPAATLDFNKLGIYCYEESSDTFVNLEDWNKRNIDKYEAIKALFENKE